MTDTPTATVDVPDYDLHILPEIFQAYDLDVSGLNESQTNKLFTQASRNPTFPYVIEAVNSNRHPYTIMAIGAKLGMFIPIRRRTGIHSYNYFMSNIKYYEHVLTSAHTKIPTLMDIYMSRDRLNMLMQYRDDQILQNGYRFSRNFETRKDMLTNFIKYNILTYGEFILDSNHMSSYNTDNKIISYYNDKSHLYYSTPEIIELITSHDNIPNKLCLHSLRQQILEKFTQWRRRNGFNNVTHYPHRLVYLLSLLEPLLIHDVRNQPDAYLVDPSLV